MVKLPQYQGVTPYMSFCCLVYLSGALLYGIDTGSFGSLQALPSFLSKFGKYNPTTKAYALPSYEAAAMNSIPFAGQALGALLSSFVVDWFGYKITMIILALVQIVGVIIELTANLTASWGQFTFGRFLAYVSTGLAEMAVIHFNGEVSPASTRGLLSGSMLFFNALGNLWGAGMSRAYATETQARGWLIPTAVQFIPAVLILAFIWFTVESPRWLVMKGRKDQALESLNKLRPKDDVASGLTKIEVDAIEQSLEEQTGKNEGKWLDLLKGNMLRRTWICITLFALLQATGIQFTNSFAATYYVNAGLKERSFTYVTVGVAGQIVSCAIQIGTYDIVGRRIFSILGGFLCFIFLTVLATLGSGGSAPAPVTNITAVNSVIASIILTQVFARWSVTNAFVIGGEIGGTRHRRKVLAVGGVVNMIVAILITAVTPYLMNSTPGSAGLGAKVGWFFASSSLFLAIFGIFFVPELKGRSLEETDELFEHCLWGWEFSRYKTQGIGAKIAALQDADDERLRRVSVASATAEKDNIRDSSERSV